MLSCRTSDLESYISQMQSFSSLKRLRSDKWKNTCIYNVGRSHADNALLFCGFPTTERWKRWQRWKHTPMVSVLYVQKGVKPQCRKGHVAMNPTTYLASAQWRGNMRKSNALPGLWRGLDWYYHPHTPRLNEHGVQHGRITQVKPRCVPHKKCMVSTYT